MVVTTLAEEKYVFEKCIDYCLQWLNDNFEHSFFLFIFRIIVTLICFLSLYIQNRIIYWLLGHLLREKSAEFGFQIWKDFTYLRFVFIPIYRKFTSLIYIHSYTHAKGLMKFINILNFAFMTCTYQHYINLNLISNLKLW